MNNYAVIALLDVVSGICDEATIECMTLEEAFQNIAELNKARPWKMVSIVHIEDLPKMLEGTELVGRGQIRDFM